MGDNLTLVELVRVAAREVLNKHDGSFVETNAIADQIADRFEEYLNEPA